MGKQSWQPGGHSIQMGLYPCPTGIQSGQSLSDSPLSKNTLQNEVHNNIVWSNIGHCSTSKILSCTKSDDGGFDQI